MITWGTPRSCQGQIVERSYLTLDNEIIERSHDRSDGATGYRLAATVGDKWTWYESREPGGAIEPPPIPDDRWRLISADRVALIVADLDLEGR
jgi:hypothetical protein